MGDPVTISLIAGAGASMGSAGLSGLGQKNSLKAEQYQLQTQKKTIQTNAAIAQAERLNKLQGVLSSQNAAMAMRGQSSGFGSAGVIMQESMNQAAREQHNENLQTNLAEMSMDYNISSTKKAASNAVLSSLFSAGVDLANQYGSSAIDSYFKPVDGGKK